jgi:ATP-dependent helicase/nuclease subunit B
MTDGNDAVQMIAAPDRVGEVRAALRWLKERLVKDGMLPWQVALLARDLEPYRDWIQRIAGEFQVPVRLMDGRPLQGNPAVAALLGVLQLVLPRSAENPEFRLPRRGVVEAWRSPYFDWSLEPDAGTTGPIRINNEDADALDAVARWGRVVGGVALWEEVLDDLVDLTSEREAEDDERGSPPGLPTGQAASSLQRKFRGFLRLLEPPAGVQSTQRFVAWLEDLIGTDGDAEDETLRSDASEPADGGGGLQMVAQIRGGTKESAERDLAALAALKDVLRGLVWAEDVLGNRPTDYAGFHRELTGAVEACTLQLPQSERDEILVADVLQARGVPLRAVAILGLAEGEFPMRLREDALLRDADRRQLRGDARLRMELSVESAEAEFFYEAVTRGRERILLTRPRLDDTGALWQPSPFWEEVVRLVDVVPATLTGEHAPRVDQAASWSEFVESLVVHGGNGAAWRWIVEEKPIRLSDLEHAATVLRRRGAEASGSVYDGDLGMMTTDLASEFGPGSSWSASRLESYRACPFRFFVTSLLELEPREEPTEGLDARQLGNIYHRILERIYKAPVIDDLADPDQLLVALERVADEILDEAPAQEGFRETAWWEQTRAEIVQNVRRSLEALSALPHDLVPMEYEVAFGFKGAAPLVVRDGDDSFRLRGLIDRIDRSRDGRLRVIDYKTSHPAGFDNRAISEGRRLQLPLYALAARDALRLGEPVEGFYWHVRHAEASRFSLSSFPGGPGRAFEIAVEKAWEAIAGVRRGLFIPHPPDGGCPSYCPAAGFCWHFRAGWGGGG